MPVYVIRCKKDSHTNPRWKKGEMIGNGSREKVTNISKALIWQNRADARSACKGHQYQQDTEFEVVTVDLVERK